MKFTITFKDPDGVYDSLRDAVIGSMEEGLSDEETNLLYEHRCEKLSDFIEDWVEFDEYITIEFDTGAGTATVVPL